MKKVSGSAFSAYLLFACLLTSVFANGQDYQRKLEWQPNTKSFKTIEEKTITQPTFTGSAHLEQYGLLPCYIEQFPLSTTSDVKATLINPVYSPAGNIDNNSRRYLQETAGLTAELSVKRKTPFAYITLVPFRKNPTTGAIEKLESFTIRLSVTPKPQSRGTNAYASTSVLATGTWYKVAVSTDGIYKIDYTYLKSTVGINPDDVTMSKLAIFGNGGGMVPDQNSIARPDDLLENPTMLVDNNNNNKFDQDDYLLFYGQMPDAWTYDSVSQSYKHTKNLYANKTTYFLTPDAGTGKRIVAEGPAGNATHTITSFDERAFHESDEVNMLQSGKKWLGDKMTSYNGLKSFSYNFPNLVTSVPVKFTSAIATNTTGTSNTNVKINALQVITHTLGPTSPDNIYAPVVNSSTTPVTYNASSNQINIEYSFLAGSDPSASAACYIDYFELNLQRSLTLSGNSMAFRNASSVGAGNISNFILSGASSNTKIWDVTAPGTIHEMQGTLSGSQLSYTTPTGTLKEFIAFNTGSASSFTTPDFVNKVDNQNLHAIGQPNMVIVTHDDFVTASNDLADFHRTIDTLTVSVVKLSQIYNEFSSGRADISAIRDFVRMLYERAPDVSQAPKYLLLMGDGSFDPKDRIANANDFIPTYQSYESYSPINTFVSDDFYGLLDPNEGGDIAYAKQLLDIGIGRLPVETELEAADVVSKIKDYKRPPKNCSTCVQANSNNSWRNNITFIADDEDGDIHIDASDQLAEATRSVKPVYNYDKIYLDAYKQVSSPAGDRYPDVNTAILNRINSGTLLVNWVGHGGPTNWAHERIFNMAEISQLKNRDKLPLFITATCDFSAYDLIDRTAGESLVVNGKGGAIAAITTVRLVFSNANKILNDVTFDKLFEQVDGRDARLGEIMTDAKNAAVETTDVANTRKFTLLGDPALQLNYPHYNVSTTRINNVPVALPHDALKALSQVTISGEIQDDNFNKISSFNGVIYPVVYDKISTLQTLSNDGSNSPTRQFKMYKNVLFKGKASVVNGEFSFTFIVPKDINYQLGPGRISYYADNGNYVDAHGFSTDIVIGGSADSAAVDKTGPQMKIFMNDEKFVFGGTTDANPVLLINLFDESGINTVGNGVGHDLTAVLDEDNQNKVTLNDYYESAQDSFQKGSVKYPFSKLTEGRHSLRVKAWDIYNNSTEDYTEFIVTSNAKLALNHVYNYPNPFTTRTQFMFEHNRPCDVLNVSVQIYSVGGRLVKSIVNQQIQSVGYRVDNIEWDGLDDYGDAIGKGVYVYKVSVRDSNGNTAHKFEKLVVLR